LLVLCQNFVMIMSLHLVGLTKLRPYMLLVNPNKLNHLLLPAPNWSIEISKFSSKLGLLESIYAYLRRHSD
jgi:hypothetical protein